MSTAVRLGVVVFVCAVAAACVGTDDPGGVSGRAGQAAPDSPVHAGEVSPPAPGVPAPGTQAVEGEVDGVSTGGSGTEIALGDAEGDVRGEELVSVSVGGFGSVCGLAVSGRLVCSPGEAPAGRFVAVSVSPSGRFDASDGFACGVRVGGAVACWGVWGDVPEAVAAVPEGVFTAVAAGGEHVCAVDEDGAVVCWGDGFDGGGVPPGGRFVSVSAGYSSTCGIRVGGSVACWDADYEPAFEADTSSGPFESLSAGLFSVCGVRVGGELACWGDDLLGVTSPPEGLFVSVGVGFLFSCGVRVGGEVECWGVGEPYGCLWIEVCHGWDAYPGLAPAGPFAAVAVDRTHMFEYLPKRICGLRVGGELVCWNDGSETARPPVGQFVVLDGGEGFVCGVRVGGAGQCWGQAPYAWDLQVPLGWAPAEGVWASVSAGWGHGCGLRPDGRVGCWGADLYGETRPPPGVFVEVSAGRRLTCGLRPDRQAVCWGANEWWQATPPPGRFTTVAAGDGFACGLRPSRRIECWGRPFGAEVPAGSFASLSLAGHACAVDSVGGLDCWVGGESLEADHPGGAFVSVSAWGDYACGLRADRSVECWGDTGTNTSPDGAFETVTVGSTHACGVRRGGDIDCWRRFPLPFSVPLDEPVAGRGDRMSGIPWEVHRLRERAAVPEPVGVLFGLEWVGEEWSGQEWHSEDWSGQRLPVGYRTGDEVRCWDNSPDNGAGASVVPLAAPQPPESELLAAVADGGAFAVQRISDNSPLPPTVLAAPEGCYGSVSHRRARTCGVRSDGEAACWGAVGDHGGHLPPPGPFVAIAAGGGEFEGHLWSKRGSTSGEFLDHTCALRSDGTVLCWGSDQYKQATPPPERIDASPYVAISAGVEHTCALSDTGEVLCWGHNLYGQTSAPPGPFAVIAAGDWHTCGLRPNGDAECWGDPPGGSAAGFGDFYADPPPGAPREPPPGPFVAISAGDGYTCAERPDGEETCWYSY